MLYCTVMLHSYTAQLYCTEMLHSYTAQLYCTVMLQSNGCYVGSSNTSLRYLPPSLFMTCIEHIIIYVYHLSWSNLVEWNVTFCSIHSLSTFWTWYVRFVKKYSTRGQKQLITKSKSKYCWHFEVTPKCQKQYFQRVVSTFQSELKSHLGSEGLFPAEWTNTALGK